MGQAIDPEEVLSARYLAGYADVVVPVAASAISRVKDAIRVGEVYSLCDVGSHGSVAVLYVAQDRRLAVVIRMDTGATRRDEPIDMTFLGLDPMLRYTARLTSGGALPPGLPASAPGSYYMARRFQMPLTDMIRGAALVLDAGPGA